MKVFAIVKGVLFRIIRREWIAAKGCAKIPVYVVEDSRVFVLARSLRVKK